MKLTHYAVYNMNHDGFEDLVAFLHWETMELTACPLLKHDKYLLFAKIGEQEIISGMFVTRITDLTNDVEVNLSDYVTQTVE